MNAPIKSAPVPVICEMIPTPFRPSKSGIPVLRLDEAGRRAAAFRVSLARQGKMDTELHSPQKLQMVRTRGGCSWL